MISQNNFNNYNNDEYMTTIQYMNNMNNSQNNLDYLYETCLPTSRMSYNPIFDQKRFEKMNEILNANSKNNKENTDKNNNDDNNNSANSEILKNSSLIRVLQCLSGPIINIIENSQNERKGNNYLFSTLIDTLYYVKNISDRNNINEYIDNFISKISQKVNIVNDNEELDPKEIITELFYSCELENEFDWTNNLIDESVSINLPDNYLDSIKERIRLFQSDYHNFIVDCFYYI